jgi:CBS domain-containing protein
MQGGRLATGGRFVHTVGGSSPRDELEATVRIREIMSKPAVVVPPECSVKEAAATLDAHGFTCLPVVTGDGRLVGVVSEAELLVNRFPPDPRVPIFERVAPVPGPTVGEVMVRDVLVTRQQEGVADLLTVLRSAGIRSVPVVEYDGTVVGVVTYRDLLRALARDDAAIEADIRRKLDIYGGFGRWRADVRNGEVTIFDDRADLVERSGAMRVAESVIGVSRCQVVDTG